ncbi:MAG: DUF2993 domain-containing protein [Leptolyngbyaceae cyanobacterium RU_5_1]|nr:DUF2993 domain-containing protein [Leptolyngbyaceae cyanobacterium RU_5_1]
MGSDPDPVELANLTEHDDEAKLDFESQPSVCKQSRIISRVLAPALRFWLRSQLDQVEDLELTIAAGDRQLLSGAISQVSASATKAVYRGLHLSQIQVMGEHIQTNLGQVLRGKPFRLLTSFPVTGEITLSEADLNTSFTAPLLENAVADFLTNLLKLEVKPDHQLIEQPAQPINLEDVQVELGEDELTFKAALVGHGRDRRWVIMRTRLDVENGNLLKLNQFQCQVGFADPSMAEIPNSFAFHLGSEVLLKELSIHPDGVVCRGRITVIPGE